MEFADLIKVSNVLKVVLHRPFLPPTETSLCITGHHLILSARCESVEELWILHRNIDSIERKNKGTLVIKCKNLKVIQVIIPNMEEFNNVADSLEKLSAIDDLTRSYPFFYNPSFKPIEDGWSLFQPEEEFSKLVHSTDKEWRISYVNSDFSICRTYPRGVVVPMNISDDCLRASARYRQDGRFPALSYRHSNGTVLVRCSQPLCGPNNRRCKEDENIFWTIVNLPKSQSSSLITRKGYIIDTRTPAAAQSAKSKGGGYELEGYYPYWKRINKSIDRYHYLLDSYSKLMEAVSDISASSEKWLNKLTVSSWLAHVKDILNCACLIAQCLEKETASVVVHGSEGMDITLCVTSLAQIILNPDCRTVRGFEALVVREWIQAGHPIWSRTTKGPFNDSLATKSKNHAPTFTIFLDSVWQIYHQFPCSFEFTERFLILLADHAYSSNFGTFLADCECERSILDVKNKTVSLWSYVNRPEVIENYLNPMYEPNVRIIWPSVAPISLTLWQEMYLRWIIDPSPAINANKKIGEIIRRNKEAKFNVVKLRRQLHDLLKEAESLGLIESKKAEEVALKTLNKKTTILPNEYEKEQSY